ncbi:hypothetical protein [Acetobacter fabarum]|uniref:hypothetical protein n=1 Tax=Acetobacter fabarum TaxID=483199 RepID=UPI0033BF1F27
MNILPCFNESVPLLLLLYRPPDLYYAAPTTQEPFMVMQTVAQPVTANVIPGDE